MKLFAYAILSLLFICSQYWSPYPLEYLVKILPIALLLTWSMQRGQTWRGHVIGIALVFSAAGDIAMAKDEFLPGLSAFLLAHIAYLTVFCRNLTADSTQKLLIAGIVLWSAGTVAYLWPTLGDMKIPVVVYCGVIAAMASAAIAGANHRNVAIGAALFAASDAIIAIDRFAIGFAAAPYLIMILYYAAQYLLTWDARRGEYAPISPR